LGYAISFEAYRATLATIADQVSSGAVNYGSFISKGSTRFVKQVYPAISGGVANNLSLEKNLIITGPNASGKTTQLKTTAINIIFTQQFGVGFYEACDLAPYTHIHSYLNIPDTSGRDSLFQAEARRCKEIIDVIDAESASTRHFCIFDELFSGTNAEEATSASYGFLKYLQKHENVDFILTTHFVKLCKKVKKNAGLRIANYKMDATLGANNDIKFSYKLVKGISKIKAARLILIQMGFPDEIVACIN
jgi:DNA mismatch repair ATPase MutS